MTIDKVARIETYVLKAAPLQTYWGNASWGQDRQVAARRPLSVDYPPQARRKYIYAQTLDCVLVRLETESGCVGWGEAKAPVGAEATARVAQAGAPVEPDVGHVAAQDHRRTDLANRE